MKTNWYEIWVDEGLDVPYVLILLSAEAGYQIFDPAERNKIVFASANYDDAKFWLLEDEYVRVCRKEFDKE